MDLVKFAGCSPDPVMIKADGRDLAVEDPGPGSGFPIRAFTAAASLGASADGKDP
jgi:hypothetical protein